MYTTFKKKRGLGVFLVGQLGYGERNSTVIKLLLV